MLKLKFIKAESKIKTTIELYNSVSRIPFTITLGDCSLAPAITYARNHFGANLVEVRFSEISNSLYDVTAVSLVTSESYGCIQKFNCEPDFYICTIEKHESNLEGTLPMKVKVFTDSIKIEMFSSLATECIFKIGHNIYLGVNEASYLSCIILNGLNKSDVSNIMG